MKLIAKISHSDKLRFPDRVLFSEGRIHLIAKNEYDRYSLDANNNIVKEKSIVFPAFDEIMLAEFETPEKHVFVTKTDKKIHVYTLNKFQYLELINKLDLDEENITVFVSDDKSTIVIYNVSELIIFKTEDLFHPEPKAFKRMDIGEKCALLKVQVIYDTVYGLMNIEKSQYIGRVDLSSYASKEASFELKLLNYKASDMMVCGEHICVYADDESFDLYIYSISDLFNGKTSIDTEFFRDKKIYISQMVKLFRFDNTTMGALQSNNSLTLIDMPKMKRIHKVIFNNLVEFGIGEVVECVHIGNNKILVKSLNELCVYDMEKSELKVIAKFKEVFEEVIDLSA